MSTITTRSALRTRRFAVLAGALALGASTLAATGPASASTISSTVAAYALPMTVSGGWVTYNDTVAAKLGFTGLKTVTVAGTASGNGACSFTDSGKVASGAAGSYSEEISYNTTTCQEKVLTGTLTKAELTKLNALSGQTGKAAASSANTLNSAATGSASSKVVRAASYTSSSAYEKSAWIDPVDITITSLADDLTWTHDGSAWGTANASVHPYEFSWDGWSNSGTPAVDWYSSTYNIGMTETENFYNTDFAEFVEAALGLASYLACDQLGDTTVYHMSDYIVGYGDGGYGWGQSDTKTGACANLVHHNEWNGFGSLT